MYSDPSQPTGWNPNAPPPNGQQPGQNNQSPSQTPAQQPQWPPHPNSQFAPRPNQQIPPISQALPPQTGGPTMQTLQPQHPDQYRALPAPHQMYPPHYPPQQQPPMQYAPAPQPAPRQRTAIACRYCRRRKIRCSGFDQSEDGRCGNCQRFNQECIFTPVSSQSQAFVPAHTVWARGQQAPPHTQLYGAYGQPLRADPYPQGQQPPPPQPGQPGQPQQQPPPQQQQHQHQHQHQPPPPQQQQQQQHQQQQHQQAGQYPPPPPGYQQQQQPYQQAAPMTGSKRPTDEPHTPTLAPPPPNYIYPDSAAGLNSIAKEESISGMSVDSNDRKNERIRNGEVRDFGVQTDESAFSR